MFLAGEILVDRPRTQPGLLADVLDAGLVKPLTGETGLGGIHDLLPAGFRMGFSYFRHGTPLKNGRSFF